MKTNRNFTKINPDTYVGEIPKGADLVIAEKNSDIIETAIILNDFDEVGEFEEIFENPIYGFLLR